MWIKGKWIDKVISPNGRFRYGDGPNADYPQDIPNEVYPEGGYRSDFCEEGKIFLKEGQSVFVSPAGRMTFFDYREEYPMVDCVDPGHE